VLDVPCIVSLLAMFHGLYIGVCVCVLDTLVSPAKIAEAIEMPFGLSTWLGLRNHLLDGVPDPPWKRQF